MATLSSSSPASAPQKASTSDELSMQQSLFFTDSLKDLKNLRAQLYSAAAYFELSYSNDEQKQIVISTLKDYAVKALVNTVDHLGSMSYKVNVLIDEKVDEVSSSELRVSCIEQRIQTCKDYMNHEGRAQQSLVLSAPRFHKRYLIPDEPMPESGRKATVLNQEQFFPCKEVLKSNQIHNDIISPSLTDRPPSLRKLHTLSPTTAMHARSSSPQKGRSSSPSPSHGKFLTGKRTISPLPAVNPLVRSGSLSIKPTILPVEAQKSFPMRLHAERNDNKEIERLPSKSKSFLKTLLSRRRSRKDEMLYSYIDEY